MKKIVVFFVVFKNGRITLKKGGEFTLTTREVVGNDRLFPHAIDCAKQVDIVSPGDRVVITAGVPLNIEGMTNLLKVQIVN